MTDGGFVLRPLGPDDLDVHLGAVDQEQIRWLWEPGDGEKWHALTALEQHEHQPTLLKATFEDFGRGPKWVFAVDAPEARYAVYIDCDLANPHVPPGAANISYACHPANRGKGYTVRATRLACEFLRAETVATEACIVVEDGNTASLRVARAVGASEADRFLDEHGRCMIRHMLPLRG